MRCEIATIERIEVSGGQFKHALRAGCWRDRVARQSLLLYPRQQIGKVRTWDVRLFAQMTDEPCTDDDARMQRKHLDLSGLGFHGDVFGEFDQGCLGDRIRGCLWPAINACVADNIDDATPVVAGHHVERCSGAKKTTEQMGLEGVPPLCGFYFPGFAQWPHIAGVVDQKINGIELLDDLFETPFHCGRIGYIQAQAECLAVTVTDFLYGSVQMGLGAPHQYDDCAGVCQSPGDDFTGCRGQLQSPLQLGRLKN